MTTTIERLVELTTIDCGKCGGTYAINERYREQCYEKGTSWTCPYCRCRWGYAEGENARLKAQAERARERAEYAERAQERAEIRAKTERQRAAGFKGVLTKTKRRIAAGVCPCCNRTFTDLAQHMAGQHPDYVEAP